MTDNERVRALAERLCPYSLKEASEDEDLSAGREWWMKQTLPKITAALAEARAEALYEAAQVCDRWASHRLAWPAMTRDFRGAAEQIRALAQAESPALHYK